VGEHGDGDKLIWPSEVGWDAMFAGLAETYQANVLKTLLEWQQKADYTGPMILYQAQNDRAAYVQGILNRDDNGDGIVDVNIDTNGDGIPDANIDADHNNRPDLLDAADREAYYGFWKNDGSEKPAVGAKGALCCDRHIGKQLGDAVGKVREIDVAMGIYQVHGVWNDGKVCAALNCWG